jgi:predicted acylesterase/phospholipase RssA
MRRKWWTTSAAVAAALGWGMTGCTVTNAPMNSAKVPLEDRVKNETRAAVSADFGMLRPGEGEMRGHEAGLGPVATSRPVGTGRPGDDDGYFVGVAISGGGSRSANFSAACLMELQKIGLLQYVDYISTVSGGSLTGAFYCARKDADWNPASVQRKFSFPFAADAWGHEAAFWNLFAVMFTTRNRSDILSESFDAVLFKEGRRSLTFADLRDDRPRLLINSTDLQSGRRFVFCNETFDEINSDLSDFKLSYAVAASSAVPVVLHPVAIRDYSTIFRQYRHLVDGGVSDNLGVQTLAEVYDSHVKDAERRHLPPPYPRGAILIVIDSTTSFDTTLSERKDIGLIEGLQLSASLTATSLLNRASSATMAEMIVRYSPPDVPAGKLREQIKEFQDRNYLDFVGSTGRPVKIVRLSLDRLGSLEDLPFKGFAQSVNNIDTYFNISKTGSYQLFQAAGILVKDQYEPHLKQMVEDLRTAKSRPTTQETSLAR